MDKEIGEIYSLLDRIEEILTNGRLPRNAAGDLMSGSLSDFHSKLSARLSDLQKKLEREM
jgi:hypothetical protein